MGVIEKKKQIWENWIEHLDKKFKKKTQKRD